MVALEFPARASSLLNQVEIFDSLATAIVDGAYQTKASTIELPSFQLDFHCISTHRNGFL